MATPGKMPPDAVARAQVLRDEGMPMSWIAEDIGYDPHTIAAWTTRAPGAAAAWSQAWGEIQRHQHLMDLHWEFAPRKSRRS